MEKYEPKKDSFQHKKFLVRMILVAILAVLAFVATFALESISERKTITSATEFSYRGARLNLPFYAYLNSENGDAETVLSRLSYEDDEYIFNMTNGRIFGNFTNSSSDINLVIADKIVIIPESSMFEVNYNESDGTVYLANFAGNTYIGFLPSDVKISGYVDKYDGMLNNVLFVPAGMRTRVYLSRADDRLKTVLPSKLAKEFSYGKIPYDSEKGVDLFDRKNFEEAAKYNEVLKTYQRDNFKILADQNYGVVSKTYDLLSKTLTVFTQKKNDQYIAKLQGVLYEALITNNSQNIDDKLLEFRVLAENLGDYGVSREYYVDFLRDVVSVLLCFQSSDSEYKVLSFIVDELKSELDSVTFSDLISSTVVNDIYFARNVESSYRRVYTGVEKLINGVDDTVKYKKALTFYNEYFYNLISRFPELYKMDYLSMKASIEKALFDMYYSGQSREEIKQTIVSEKIAMLKTLRDFFFNEKIAIDDARKVMSFLVQNINDYMPAKTSKNAVIALFQSELKDIGNFWGYINNVEYAKSSLYGTTHVERFKVYLTEKSQVTSILDVQRDILGTDVIVAETPEDVQAEIEKVMSSYGANSIVVEKPDDVQKRYVKVSASLGGYEFNGEYDRDYGYLKNVYAYGQLISASNIKVDALSSLLSKALSDVVATVGVDIKKAVPRDASENAELIAETNAQKIAKTLIAKKVIEAGFNATMENVDILDPTIALYRINGVTLTSSSNIKVSFDYSANDSLVKNVYVQNGSEGKSLAGDVPLETLKDVILNEKI